VILAFLVPAAVPSTVALSTGAAEGSTGSVLSASQVVAALAAEGVGVYASASSATPLVSVSHPIIPLRMLVSQAYADAAATSSHAGILGSALNSLAPMPAAPVGKTYVPFDYLLAAYATAHATPGEILAGKLLGSQDWSQPNTIVFPNLVLTLFTADATRAAQEGRDGARGKIAAGAFMPNDLGSLCSTLSSWTSQIYNSVFNTLTLGQSSNAALNFLGGLWNHAVTLAKSAIDNIASLLNATVVGAITKSLGVIGLASWAVSTLQNLHVSATAVPPYNSFGVDPAPPNTGKLTITVGNTGGFDWPAGLVQCASDLNVTLPSLNSVLGRTVTWTINQIHGTPTSAWCTTGNCDLATEDTAATTLGADHTASFAYKTNTESADQAAGTLITNDSVLVKATVSLDTAKLQTLLSGIVLGGVPGAVKVVVGPMFSSLTGAVLSKLASIAQPSTFRYIMIEHHAKPELLPLRSCVGLFTLGDFNALTETTTEADDNYVCEYPFNVTTTTNASGGSIAGGGIVSLEWFPDTAEAHAWFEDKSAIFSDRAPDPGVGDEAATGTGLEGPTGIVRVDNLVLLIVEYVPTEAAIGRLLPLGAAELCPSCTFPAS
jgi:hypothetical protein